MEACAYGNASAQYDYYNYDGSTNVRKAFDGQLNNSSAAPTSTCATQSQWMQFTFNTPTDVAGFAITPRNSQNARQDTPRFPGTPLCVEDVTPRSAASVLQRRVKAMLSPLLT